ncbi:MAG: hypothetical protein JSR24_20150 [Proteobacteria bacterium]|nr:hypothetical protein [Pseudomonadota bacterium]
MNAVRAVSIVQWLGIVAFVAVWAMDVPGYRSVWDNSYMRTAIAGECALRAAMLAFALYTTLTMVRRQRLFPVLFAAELILVGALPTATFLWNCIATGVGGLALLMMPGVLLWTALGVFAAALWTLTVRRSPGLAGAFVTPG